MEFNYWNVPDLESGYYVVAITPLGESTTRTVAEYDNSNQMWMQIGVDYDVWQYHGGYVGALIEVIGRIDLNTCIINLIE